MKVRLPRIRAVECGFEAFAEMQRLDRKMVAIEEAASSSNALLWDKRIDLRIYARRKLGVSASRSAWRWGSCVLAMTLL